VHTPHQADSHPLPNAISHPPTSLRRGQEAVRVSRLGVEWDGMEWSGMEWSGMQWNGTEWSGDI